MKKFLIISAVAIFLFVLSAQVSEAKTWLSPHAPYTESYMAGNCYMVDTLSEADSTHVYTLNPDNTSNLNFAYWERWRRNARCDELQFHVDHNTPSQRLKNWLDEVAFGWYANIGNTHFKGQTISTSKHEWFFVDQNGIHRIPDWLTGLSWGLLIGNRLSIPTAHEGAFYQKVAIGAPLNFADGQYADKIHDIWLEGDDDFSTLPTSMEEEIELLIRESDVFNACAFSWYSAFPGNPWRDLFDWTWMLRNSGCPLAD